MSFFHRLSNNLQGILCIISACFLLSVLVAIVRYLSRDFHVFFIVMMRNFFGLLFFLPQILGNCQRIFKTSRLRFHLFRGFNGLISNIVWFYVITVLPMSEAVSISFVIPILTTIAAVIFLKEKVSTHNWIASLIGLIGILIILRPGFREFNFAYFYCFISIILWTASNIIIKLMTKTEKPQTIVAYMSLIMLVGSIPLALPHLAPIGFKDLLWLAAIGLISNLAHTMISLAYSKTDLSTVQPFDFMRLIFTAIISYFAFGEVIDVWVVVGSLVILLAVIIVMPKRKRKQVVATVDS